MAERTWRWVDEMSDAGVPLAVLAPAGARSPTVTCIRVPEDRGGPGVVSALKQRGWTIGAGYGKLRDTTIRIGHMGEHTLDELEALLAELRAVLGA